ncbi:hypothetical protein CDQ84_18445 [Clostridium thermosuccinogenes]|uniref:Uncharacterized protein n=2 Tax=Clostridium thermosuccinogenes TaxID=84032 RepID=A0A2K2EYX5_9CLOT|nr:hypothetical protein [Pseudoclostridium thermosuccinogenes]AUS96081.1 hypothetical protein CDO33_06290 [Pseudoclostridium thermosuccinogenes]PNT91722.1 hypothetical protein CDQ85_19075 [Pseudoclostridium thermosuccinogenes]PNT94721.1 hypothetical protein CDQ84_18445 [Pseudoclostridium thermosuccinogenes]
MIDRESDSSILCVHGSAAARRVKVPLDFGLGSSYPNLGVMSQGLAEARGQGVHCEMESEGFEEKYQAVINGSDSTDEPVGQRRGKVEPALWRRRRSNSPVAPRCLRTAWYGRKLRDPWRPCIVCMDSKASYKATPKCLLTRCKESES